MKKLMTEIVETLEKINTKFGETKIKKSLFEENKENIQEFENTYNELIIILNEINKKELIDQAFIDEKLTYLILDFSIAIWCFDQLDKLMRLVLQKNSSMVMLENDIKN